MKKPELKWFVMYIEPNSKLVKKYKIGKVVDDFSDVSFLNDKIDINSNYCIDHTVEKFYKQLLNIK